MKLNQKLVIGINAISTLRNETDAVRAEDLAAKMNVSVHFLEQVLRKLRMASLVEVKRGPGGGYTVDKTKKVFAHDVAIAVGVRLQTPTDLGMNPVEVLNNSITQAFYNTAV